MVALELASPRRMEHQIRPHLTVVRESVAAYAVRDPVAEMDSSGIADAGVVHSLIKSLHALGNEVRLRYIDALRVLHDDSLCFELGYTSYHQYCERELGLARSTAYEYLRAASALDALPRLRALFGQGELSWHQVREICRVATADTEVAWLELALEAPIKELLAEVREAIRTGRTAPREKRLGLPNLVVKVTIEMTLEEKERVRTAFALMGEALGGGDPDPGPDAKPVLVRWADGVLSGAIPRTPAPLASVGGEPAVDAGGATTRSSKGRAAGNGDRATPAQTIVYHTCRECRLTTVGTAEGPVEVNPDRIEALAPVSTTMRIAPDEELSVDVRPADSPDSPNNTRLSRQVLARDWLTCANPCCGSRRNLHAHHIIYRSKGGPTALANEVAVCDVCHTALHMGILELRGSPSTALEWLRHPSTPGAKVRDAASLRTLLDCMPDSVRRGPESAGGAVIHTVSPRHAPVEDLETVPAQSTIVDAPPVVQVDSPHARQVESPPVVQAVHAPAEARGAVPRDQSQVARNVDLERRLRLLEEGLVSLRFTPDEAQERVRNAYQALTTSARLAAESTGSAPRQPTDDEIITLAVYGEAKAAAVWEFHAKRRQSAGTK